MDEDDITSLTTKMASTNIKFIDQDVDVILDGDMLMLVLKSSQSKIRLNQFDMNNVDILKLDNLINQKISQIHIICDNDIGYDSLNFDLSFHYIKNISTIFYVNSVGNVIYDITISDLTMKNILRKIFFHKLKWYKDNIEKLCNNVDQYMYDKTFDINKDLDEYENEEDYEDEPEVVVQNRLNLIFDKLYQYYKFVPKLEEKCRDYEVKTKKREKQTTKRHADDSDEDDSDEDKDGDKDDGDKDDGDKDDS